MPPAIVLMKSATSPIPIPVRSTLTTSGPAGSIRRDVILGLMVQRVISRHLHEASIRAIASPLNHVIFKGKRVHL